MENHTSQIVKYRQYLAGNWKQLEAPVAIEQSVALVVDGKVWMDMACTPDQLDCLAVGFLYNERMINSAEDVVHVHVCETRDFVEIQTQKKLEKPRHWRKTTGCSGGETSQKMEKPADLHLAEIQMKPQVLLSLLEKFLEAQNLASQSRGVHASALSDGESILCLAVDVGRHNTLDKLAGYCLLHGLDLPQPVIFTSGRISSEMLQKSSRLGTSIIVSLTAANAFTIEMAQKWGITLVGYARGNSFNVYSHPQRLLEK